MIDSIDVTSLAPLTHDEAMRLQDVELQRAVTQLRSLSEDEWQARTDCPEWDVREMYLHVLGACESGASITELLHQMRRARSRRRHHGGPMEAALSATQVEERRHLTGPDIITRLAATAPRTVRSRRRLPGVIRRHATFTVDGPVFESWSLGYLVDTIYLRDLWMHRVDLSRAIGRPLEITHEHDGRVVGDVVAEWARRHGRPFTLELLGVAGGHYRSPGPQAGDTIVEDAVEFCRTLAGRRPGSGLLETVVPF